MQWMEEGWQTHECYAFYGVNGTFCSFRTYLSEIEKYCPVLPWRKALKDDTAVLPKNEVPSVVDLRCFWNYVSCLFDSVFKGIEISWVYWKSRGKSESCFRLFSA